MLRAVPDPQWAWDSLQLDLNLVTLNLDKTTPGNRPSKAVERQAGPYRLGAGGTGSAWLHLESILQPHHVMTWFQCSRIFSIVCRVFHLL